MKAFLSLLVVLAMTFPLYAAPITLLQEDFSGGVIGNSVTSLGWVSTGAGDGNNIKIGSTPGIGSGQSANFMDVVSPWNGSVSKTFAYTPAADETYTFTVTLDAPGIGGEYSEAMLWKSGAPGQYAKVQVGYNAIWLEVYGGVDSRIYSVNGVVAFGGSQPTTPIDVKFELSNTLIEVAVRNYGDSAWINVNTLTPGASLSGFDTVSLLGHGGGWDSNVNSITLTTTPVPEPSMIALAVTGLLGLSSTSRRKRAT